AVLLAVASSAAGAVPDGACEGIGFGCTLTARDTLLIVGVGLGVIVVPVATIVAAVVARRSSDATRLHHVLLTLGAFALVALLITVVLAQSVPA
ncbi:MAG: hypothetical protein ABL966_10560, partial [Acidimicrobiales bacterium]